MPATTLTSERERERERKSERGKGAWFHLHERVIHHPFAVDAPVAPGVGALSLRSAAEAGAPSARVATGDLLLDRLVVTQLDDRTH